MLNFTTFCALPAYCHTCHKLVQVNLLEQPLRCHAERRHRAVLYDDPSLVSGLGQTVVAS